MKQLICTTLSIAVLATACNKNNDKDVLQYKVNTTTSVVEWKGATPATSNTGSFDLASSNIDVRNGKVIKGEFVIPIATIKNFNLPDELKEHLLTHLKSSDFFNLLVHPDAKFKFTRSIPYDGTGNNPVTGANYWLTGDFTMLGKTNEIIFPAKIQLTRDSLAVEALFTLDRSHWGMNYANDAGLGDNYIYPGVDIHLKLKAGKN